MFILFLNSYTPSTSQLSHTCLLQAVPFFLFSLFKLFSFIPSSTFFLQNNLPFLAIVVQIFQVSLSFYLSCLFSGFFVLKMKKRLRFSHSEVEEREYDKLTCTRVLSV
ncbi:hypothetical protein RND81_03G028300 [Saponaria officinalis]|uniref:Uncharacterized protein n=1 Tax=Saponaria officinalis TaxID=3572 RepID=A0AAW1M253_SAPOF